jgi:hypothetical protein
MHAKRFLIALALTTMVTMPRVSSAETLLTPFAGVTFGGSGQSTGTFGAGFAWMGAGIFGVEFEAAYTPSFFDTADFDFVDSDNVVTVMGNLILGIPAGGTDGPGVRPYGTIGFGLLRTNVTSVGGAFDNVSNSDFGMNVGGGLMGFFNDHVGLRGDVRYFRALTDPEEDFEFDVDFGDLDFWRGTLGVVFRF